MLGRKKESGWGPCRKKTGRQQNAWLRAAWQLEMAMSCRISEKRTRKYGEMESQVSTSPGKQGDTFQDQP